jgi:class 3 adenylate cyclase/tetratricopeptide (TPR) repeat protein
MSLEQPRPGVCPSCAARVPSDARFCLRCGVRLTAHAPPLPEERKTVSVLFCDIVGFTAMSEQADPEDVDVCLRAFGTLARSVIERYGGSVEKFIGDAVVGVFGVPAVHEDDPERAVHAALRLLDGLSELRRPDGAPLEARAGIMTGELLVAHRADPALGEGLVAGDAVNTAQRLEASAEPGTVVVGDLTYRLTRDAIAYDPLPPSSVKGKTRPLERWRGLRPLTRSGFTARSARLSPMVGRDSELSFCRTLLQRVITGGKAQFALILGDPGIGKTRLLHELRMVVDAGPDVITWRQGRCVPYGEERAFWALREIVQSHAGILETHDPGQVAELLERMVDPGPDHRWLCERLRPLVGLDAPEAEPEENYAAWLRYCRQVASHRPLVLIVEDLHWADESLIAFMDHVASHLPEGPMLLVLTARPEVLERHPAFAASGGRVTRIWLDRLTDDETTGLVAALPEMRGASPAAVDVVARRAEGNPFYAEELARLLAGGTGGDPLPALAALPRSVQAVIAARIDALSPGAKATLADGAVIGGSFWRSAIQALAGPAVGDVAESLAELVDRQLVRPVLQVMLEGEEEYAFCHGLVRDVAYGEVPRATRARKHAAFARWVEDKVGERARGDMSDILAWHYGAAAELAGACGAHELEADAADAAVDYLMVSGDRAMGLDARAAARHFERALALAGPVHPSRPALLSRAAEALFQEGRYRESSGFLSDAAAGFWEAGDARSAALSAARRADVLYALGDPGVTLQLQEALDLLDGVEPCTETVTVLGKLGRSLWLAGDPPRGLERLEDALDLSRRLGLPEPVLFLGYRGGIRCIMGDGGGLDDYRQALGLASERGRVDEASLLTFNYADALLSYFGPRAAAEVLIEGLDAARLRRREAVEALPVRDGVSMRLAGEWDAETSRRLAVNLVEALGLLGEWRQTLAAAEELTPELERSEAASDLVIVRAQEALLYVSRGEPAYAAPFLEWLERRGLESEIPWISAYALLSAAPVRFDLGETDTALSLLDGWERRPRPGSGPNYVAYLPLAVRTSLRAGDDGLAERLCSGLEETLPMQRNVLATLRGLLGERNGELELAAASFEDAAAGWRGFCMPCEEGHALLGRGRCLSALGSQREAEEPLEAARGIFERLGARPALRETDEWLAG